MEQSRLGYQRNFDSTRVTPFAELLEALQPGATGKAIAALLDHRAERTRALHWRAGRRGPPQWAIDLLVTKLERKAADQREAIERAKQIKAGPGIRAGAANLARWKVAQAAKRNASDH